MDIPLCCGLKSIRFLPSYIDARIKGSAFSCSHIAIKVL